MEASSSFSTSTNERKYDVFISFRGADTRLSFSGYLAYALREKGIKTFFDDGELQKGEVINSALKNAIKESRIALVIFSENYASSKFCLEELSEIMECRKEKGTLVWPVFYKVDPAEVRHQRGSYAEAFENHEGRYATPIIRKWRLALQEAAHISGSHYYGQTYEHKFINDIINEIIQPISKKAEAKIHEGPHEDLENYLQTIAKLRSDIQFFDSIKDLKNRDGVINHANSLLAKAISKLEDEFKRLLSSYSKPVEPEVILDCIINSMRTSSELPAHEDVPNVENHSNSHSDVHNNNADAVVYTPPVLIPPRILVLLHDSTKQMVDAGHQRQLLKIYRDARSNVLEESLQKLGVEKLNKDDVQRLRWETVVVKIGNWSHFMHVAVKLLFAGERKVCDEICEGFDSLSEQCFAEVTTNSFSMLLSFGEAFAESLRSPEKLFMLLDMYKTMQELHSEFGTLFKGKACTEIRESAMGLTKRLAQIAHETVTNFVETVQKDVTKTAVIDGAVHPLTSYVINYVEFLFEQVHRYRSTLEQIFQEFEGVEDSPHLASVTLRLIQALQTNLDGKSKQYKDLALTHLFLLNNIHYIVTSVRRSIAKDLLGYDWLQRHRRVVQQHANQYRRNACAKIILCLSIEGLASRAIVKDRFKTFNVMFEELHRKQSQWTVPDTYLRETLRLAVAQVLLPAYRSFVKRFGPLVESGKNPQMYIKYKAEDLDRLLGEFFEGKSTNQTK